STHADHLRMRFTSRLRSSQRVVVERGQVWWADLGEPSSSEPGFRRPLLVVQDDAFNRSRLRTVIAVVLTSNLRLVEAPGNVLIPAKAAGLPKDSVANVSQVITIDRDFLTEPVGRLRANCSRTSKAGFASSLAYSCNQLANGSRLSSGALVKDLRSPAQSPLRPWLWATSHSESIRAYPRSGPSQ